MQPREPLPGRLAAQNTWGVLVVLQALDAAGKDGAIRHVMSGVNPQGVSVHTFKVPSAEDLSHDYLWRYQPAACPRGTIGIFNRSHYEEVCWSCASTRGSSPTSSCPPRPGDNGVWERRFREINDWERYLTDNGIRIVKVFLHISHARSSAGACWRGSTTRPATGSSRPPTRRACLLGRLPARVLRDALAHQHRVGALVATCPGRPQVVRPHRHRRP